MLRASALGVLLFAFWLLLSGHYTPLLLTLGVLSCTLVVWLCLRMDVVDREVLALAPAGRLLLYLPWLMKEVFVSNVTVARLILDPKMPISPGVVRFRSTQRTDLGKALFANSITLTPGTVTLSVEDGEFHVHALTAGDFNPGDEAEMDRRCTRVEGAR